MTIAMLVLVQLAAGADWQPVDAARFGELAGEPIAVCVQGVTLEGFASYAVEPIDDGLRVTGFDASHADVWEFLSLAPDPRFGGALNTRQSRVVYAAGEAYDRIVSLGEIENCVVKQRDELAVPAAEITRPGVVFEDPATARQNRRVAGWREWADGLDPSELDRSGRVKPQRAQGRYDVPDGTRTYYGRSSARVNNTYTADQELALETATGSASSVSATVVGQNQEVAFVFSSPTGEPSSAAWPTGTYRAQLDVTAAAADMTYGLRTIGSAAGCFARASSDLTANHETEPQAEAVFSGTGLKLATTGSVSWSAGSASDRFVVAVAVGNAFQQQIGQTLTLEVNESDDFADGPWPLGIEVAPTPIAVEATVFMPEVSIAGMAFPPPIAVEATLVAPATTGAHLPPILVEASPLEAEATLIAPSTFGAHVPTVEVELSPLVAEATLIAPAVSGAQLVYVDPTTLRAVVAFTFPPLVIRGAEVPPRPIEVTATLVAPSVSVSHLIYVQPITLLGRATLVTPIVSNQVTVWLDPITVEAVLTATGVNVPAYATMCLDMASLDVGQWRFTDIQTATTRLENFTVDCAGEA